MTSMNGRSRPGWNRPRACPVSANAEQRVGEGRALVGQPRAILVPTMTRYLILLRGINVGGRNKVPMAALRELLESHGHAKVSSYIASGNVILSSDHTAAAIKRQLEETLPKT